MNELKGLREEIDHIDDQVICLLARRFSICLRVAAYKKEHHMATRQPEREREIKKRNAALARKYKVDEAFLDRLYEVIISSSRNLEDEI